MLSSTNILHIGTFSLAPSPQSQEEKILNVNDTAPRTKLNFAIELSPIKEHRKKLVNPLKVTFKDTGNLQKKLINRPRRHFSNSTNTFGLFN